MTKFKFMFAGHVALAILSASCNPASAIEYPWCAVYSGDMGGASNCGFATVEQCRLTVSGVGGFCEQNQFYTGPREQLVRHARKRNRD